MAWEEKINTAVAELGLEIKRCEVQEADGELSSAEYARRVPPMLRRCALLMLQAADEAESLNTPSAGSES